MNFIMKNLIVKLLIVINKNYLIKLIQHNIKYIYKYLSKRIKQWIKMNKMQKKYKTFHNFINTIILNLDEFRAWSI